jgi:hypothetical protein
VIEQKNLLYIITQNAWLKFHSPRKFFFYLPNHNHHSPTHPPNMSNAISNPRSRPNTPPPPDSAGTQELLQMMMATLNTLYAIPFVFLISSHSPHPKAVKPSIRSPSSPHASPRWVHPWYPLHVPPAYHACLTCPSQSRIPPMSSASCAVKCVLRTKSPTSASMRLSSWSRIS